MHHIFNELMVWGMASLITSITSVINFCLLVALAIFIFMRKSGQARTK